MTQLSQLGQPAANVEQVGKAFAPFLQRALAQLRHLKPETAAAS
jgi:hypothetical protein